MTPEEINAIIGSLSWQDQQQLQIELRKIHPIHPLENQWNISAEFILEAIARSQDITKRGVRGIVAELTFLNYIIIPMNQLGWQNVPLIGDLPYDALIEHSSGRQVKIQAKNQRMKLGLPLYATQQSARRFSGFENWWVAECQKTRSGIDADGLSTRPYRFGEFDILAVCLHPSTNDWSKFMFTPSIRLFPRPATPTLIEIFQPVPPFKTGYWTDNLEECISWL